MHLELTHIPLDPPPEGRIQRPSSRDDRIDTDHRYLARIYGTWHLGRFSEMWYGWNFGNWGASGIQLNDIEDLYQINDIAQLDRQDT